VWEDNNNVSDSQNAFGLLDLRTDDPTKYGWDSNPGVGCSAPGNGINGPQGWIRNYPDPNIGDLPVHYPSPTYVCRIPGFQQSTWAELDRLKDDDDSVDNNDQEDIVYFPINRCENTVPNTNIGGQLGPNSTQEVACASTPGQYDIIGFAAMKIEDILRKGDPGVNGATGSCPNNATLGLAGAGAYNKGGWSLDSIATVQCGAPSTPATITNVVVSSGQGNNATTYTQCPPTPPPGNSCDYVWDDSTHQLSWFKDSTRNGADAYNINFTWTLPGRCGIPPSSSASGHCLILLPVDVQIGTGFGQGSPDSNVLAAKLCDPAIAGSCAPVVVPPVP
jgi:hypothetical protein